MYKCPFCPSFFQSIYDLSQHKELHFHKCEVCCQLFYYEEHLKRHMDNHHRDFVGDEEAVSKDGGKYDSKANQDHESDGDDNSDSAKEDIFTYEEVKAILRYLQKKERQ